MQISVQLSARAAAAGHGRDDPTPEVDELLRQLDDVGVTIRPLHPGADDALLAPYFTVEVANDEELIGRVLRTLRCSAVVEAAYTKPPDELP